MPTVRRREVDGVPVFWVEAEGPCTAGLVFRAGYADEAVQTCGITHLVEHLAMAAVGERLYACNAVVGPTTTTFVARGTPGEMVEFFGSVCRALGSLPLERTGLEANILRTESAARAPSVPSEMAWLRYGPTGLGMAKVAEFFLHQPVPAMIEAWSRSRFTRGNCAAWIAGELPAGLEFPLIDGGLIALPASRPVSDVLLPASIQLDGDFVALSYESPRTASSTTVARIALKRLHAQARVARGLTYHILDDREAVSTTRALNTIWLDFLPDRAVDARAELLRIFAELASDGPTEEELAQDLEIYRRFGADPDARSTHAAVAAAYAIEGVPFEDFDELLRERRAVTADGCATELRQCLETAILRAPAAAGGLPGRFHWYTTSCSPVRGKVFTRSRHSNPGEKAETMVLGPDGISRVLGNGQAATVLWSDCVAMLVGSDGSRTLMNLDGYFVEFRPADWRGGHELAARLDMMIPSALRIGPIA